MLNNSMRGYNPKILIFIEYQKGNLMLNNHPLSGY